jgi:hypothetical protein
MHRVRWLADIVAGLFGVKNCVNVSPIVPPPQSLESSGDLRGSGFEGETHPKSNHGGAIERKAN